MGGCSALAQEGACCRGASAAATEVAPIRLAAPAVGIAELLLAPLFVLGLLEFVGPFEPRG
jgi:hypothetical protein